jgi:hypothetical protein
MIQFSLYLQKRAIVDMIVMSALTELIRVRSHPDWFCSFADAVCSKLNTAQTRAVRARPGRAAHSVVPDPFQMSLICINVAGKKLVIFCKLAILEIRTSCRHSTRKPRLSAQQLQLVRCFAQCRFQSNVRQYQALCCLLTKHKPVLVIRPLRAV